MDALKNRNMEEFCKIIAYEDCDEAMAALRAGYGGENHTVPDAYLRMQAGRLLKREEVQLRIHTLRQQNAEEDKGFQKKLIDDLKKIIGFDEWQYLQSNNVQLANGRTVTDYYLKTPIQNWKPEDRRLMCNGFDSSGRPRFIDKQWAYEKLLKIYQLDGKTSIDVEDILGLFAGAGLPVGNFAELNSLNNSDENTKFEDDLEENY